MMNCFGCYKENIEGYCPACRKKLFDGSRVPHVLAFDQPKPDNLAAYQEKTKRLSISGVQLKYSVRLEGNQLVLTEKSGQYILKPVPPTTLITLQDQAPENEHLTMQIAGQLFKIPVAANALIYFKDGAPAYITRRFDVKPDGTRYLQEDFAQISGKTKNTHGEHFKYDGSYEDIAKLIKKNVAAYPPALEAFFKLVVFNYLFSNGDAHLKNFSLVQTDFGDHTLSKAYDLMCTVLHIPGETDTALDLYENDMLHPFYQEYGYYGRPNFDQLAERMGLIPKRTRAILDSFAEKQHEVATMINRSFLHNDTREKYGQLYADKLKRLG